MAEEIKVAKKKPDKPAKEKIGFGERMKKFFRDYKSELKKIVWPTKDQLVQNTGVVIITIVGVAIIVGILDLLFGLGIQGLMNIRTLIKG